MRGVIGRDLGDTYLLPAGMGGTRTAPGTFISLISPFCRVAGWGIITAARTGRPPWHITSDEAGTP